jgi:peptide/nickel transport system permease protein
MRRQLGLDQPLGRQYVHYVRDLLHGDLGVSIRTGRTVAQDIATFFPATLELVVLALLLAVLTGVPLGVASAVWRDRPVDHLSRALAVTGISAPAFWLGLILIAVFYGHPAAGASAPCSPRRNGSPASISSIRSSKAAGRSLPAACGTAPCRPLPWAS